MSCSRLSPGDWEAYGMLSYVFTFVCMIHVSCVANIVQCAMRVCVWVPLMVFDAFAVECLKPGLPESAHTALQSLVLTVANDCVMPNLDGQVKRYA